MTVIEGPRELILDLHTYLAANTNDAIGELNTQIGDSITLNDIAEFATHDLEEGFPQQLIPVLSIVPIRWNIDQYSSNYVDGTVEVAFWLMFSSQNAREVQERGMRYSIAIWNTLVAGHFDNSYGWHMGIESGPIWEYGASLSVNNVLYSDINSQIIFDYHKEV